MSSAEIDLTWTDNASNESGFSVERSTDGASFSEVGSGLDFSKGPKTGQRTRPPEEWIRIGVPPIVSKEMFAAAQAQLERNRAFAERNHKKERYLLGGLTVCARCGYGYYGRTLINRGRGTRHAYYYCGASGRGPKNHDLAGPPCRNRGVRVEQLEVEVWKSVCALLQDPGRVMQEWSRRADTNRTRTASFIGAGSTRHGLAALRS